MQEIKRGLDMLETVELQILGSLHKINSGNMEGGKDIETVARKCKVTCKSLKLKIGLIEKKLENEKQKNHKLTNEVKKIQEEKRKLESELNDSKSLLTSYFDESLEDFESLEARTSEKEQVC